MKTSNWIKLIGIVCIAFGSFPLLTEIIFKIIYAFEPGGSEIVLEQKTPVTLLDYWNWIDSYLNYFVSIMYILGGIFFLLKKSFSIKLMYFVLSLAILQNLLPILLILPKASFENFHIFLFNPFTLSFVGIHVFLLIIVFQIRKNYFENQEKVVHVINLSKAKPRTYKVLTLMAALMLIVPISYGGFINYASRHSDSFEEFKILFKSITPKILQSLGNEGNLVFCLLCAMLNLICLKSQNKLIRIMNRILLILAILLFLLNLFQMM